jgi:hypothetical protein
MVDNALRDYGITINKLMETHIGINTTEAFHHGKVVLFLEGRKSYEEGISSLSADADEYSKTEAAEMKKLYEYLDIALQTSDDRTRKAYNSYKAIYDN